MRKLRLVLVITLLSILALAPARAAQGQAAASGVIAYTTGTAIHLINPDGSGDHPIYTVPNPKIEHITDLAWSPDSTRLAFVSDQESVTSFYNQDIYTIQASGRGFQKITNAPSVTQLAGFGKGTVTVDVQVSGAMPGPIFIYVAGAPAPQTLIAGSAGTTRFTFTNVADYGSHAQPVVAIFGNDRWFNAGVAPDVQPGKTVYAGTLALISSLNLSVRHISWRADNSKLGFVQGGCSQLLGISSHPEPGAFDSPLVQPDVLGFPCLVEYARNSAQASQLLWFEYSVLGSNLYRATDGQTGNGTLVYSFPGSGNLLALHWLPDGSGFIYSQEDDFGESANLYKVKFASPGTTSPLTTFTNEFTGQFSIAPDGSMVVFERSTATDSPKALWLLDLQSAQLTKLVDNGSFPSWGKPASQANDILLHLPLITR